MTRPGIARLSATPLMVDGVLYLATPLYQAAAIDARTGETLWVHNPRVYESGSPPLPSPWNHRGVAYWEDREDARIIWGTGDGHLTAVDARTGLLAADFGDNGRVSLEEGIPRARENPSRLPPPSRSPPLVVGDTIIVGSSVHDFLLMKENAPGFARAYDARTGRHKWDFHTVPQSPDEFGSDTWLDEAWRYSGNTNVWGNIAADPELGYVYLPTSTPTSDYYGGHRIGDNLFAESLICVDLETGQRVWHFQMVHHGVWDYDNPTGPNLLDITVDGRRVKALAQVTKQGFVYVFDRVTGEPIWPIEERTRGDRHGSGGRGAGADPALPDPSGAVRVPGGHPRRPDRLHAGGPPHGAGGGGGVPARARCTRRFLSTARSSARAREAVRAGAAAPSIRRRAFCTSRRATPIPSCGSASGSPARNPPCVTS